MNVWAGLALAGLAALSVATQHSAAPEHWHQLEFPGEGEVLGFGEATLPDGQRGVWTGTTQGSYRRLDDRWERWPLINGQNPAVRQLLVAPDERGLTHWWLAATEGLYRTGDGQSWLRVNESTPALAEREVLVLHLDQDPRGLPEIWIGTDNGLIIWRLGNWEVVPARTDGFQGGQVTTIRSLSENGARQIWAAGPDGLSRFRDGHWQRWARQCLRGLTVNAIETLDTGRGILLFAGTDSGLFELSLTEPDHCQRVRAPAADPEAIQGLIRDRHERLLAFSSERVERYAPPRRDGEDWQWTFFDHRDGIDGSTSWTGRQRLDVEGRVWAGSASGVWLFDAVDPPGQPDSRPEIRLSLGSDSIGRGSNEPLRFFKSKPALMLTEVTSSRPHAVRYRARLSSTQEFGPWQYDRQLSPGPLSFGRDQLIIEMADEFGQIHGPYRFPIQRGLPWTIMWAALAAILLAIGCLLLVLRRGNP